MIPPKPRSKQEILLIQYPEAICLFDTELTYNPDIAVVVGYHSEKQNLESCLKSIASQNTHQYKISVIVANDSQTNILDKINSFISDVKIIVLNINAGKAFRTRNMLLDFVDNYFSEQVWIARLDADDEFVDSNSLFDIAFRADQSQNNFILAGNLLCKDGKLVGQNRASKALLKDDDLLFKLKEMAGGVAINELPSCNLVFKSKLGLRYPNQNSAEDHWLVAELLVFKRRELHIAEDLLYAKYSLDGNTTAINHKTESYYKARKRIFEAVRDWIKIRNKYCVIGFGKEGIVYEEKEHIRKQFYNNVLAKETVVWLNSISGSNGLLPRYGIYQHENRWICKIQKEPLTSFRDLTVSQLHEFLINCINSNIIPRNIKRANLKIDANGKIKYIDIGNDIKPMSASSLLDVSARLYAIGILNIPDSYIFRYNSIHKQSVVLSTLQGFDKFYSQLMNLHLNRLTGSTSNSTLQLNYDVTLLIKCCAMDFETIEDQLLHIVQSLERPTSFFKKVVLIDSFEGEFLRSHNSGNLNHVKKVCKNFLNLGIIDEVVIFQDDAQTNNSVCENWFNLESNYSHTYSNIPLTSQLWAFDKIETKYVLQCDIDVLIARRDYSHDFLSEMVSAIELDKKVFSCGFNIAKAPQGKFQVYEALPGTFVPEVRLGLLDLERINNCKPFPNSILNGKVNLSWYRSIEAFQKQNGWKSLRGGSPKSFYIHPPNKIKKDKQFLRDVRTLCELGHVPENQFLKWDLEYKPDTWLYPKRNEEVVFLIKGRNTPQQKIQRCINSLKVQDDQDFGVILIDDASNDNIVRNYPFYFEKLQQQVTLIVRNEKVGRIPNIITAIKNLCINKESLIVILDMDDALLSFSVVSDLKAKLKMGHDLIQGSVYRTDKPLEQYEPNYTGNIRAEFGNDTWTHLRAFKKCLFDSIPEAHLKIDDKWIEECTDYATMIPMVELANNPVFIDNYLYYHERTTLNPDKAKKGVIIKAIVAKENLKKPNLID